MPSKPEMMQPVRRRLEKAVADLNGVDGKDRHESAASTGRNDNLDVIVGPRSWLDRWPGPGAALVSEHNLAGVAAEVATANHDGVARARARRNDLLDGVALDAAPGGNRFPNAVCQPILRDRYRNSRAGV